MPEEKVLAILNEGRATHFDPILLEIFLGLLPEMRAIRKENPDRVELMPPRASDSEAHLAFSYGAHHEFTRIGNHAQ